MAKYVYYFGGGKAEGDAKMRNLLGGKGANLAEMTNIGIPVPTGFTISTEVCTSYQDDGGFPDGLEKQVDKAIAKVEKEMGARFGDPDNPLLFSVRSGSRVSMPGMMDTVLNLGLNYSTIQGFIKQSGDERAAWDAYRRLIQMYGNVVMGVEGNPYGIALDELKEKKGVELDTELSVGDLKVLVDKYKGITEEFTGKEFPEDPKEQLWGGIEAVFKSWNVPRAVSYRRIHKIPGDWGTAVNVQAMVFGNMGNNSGTGVAFTRDPATGERRFYGEYLINAQGEDVVAGIRTPQPINIAGKSGEDEISLEDAMPDIYKELVDIYERLEIHYTEMQDIEFTIQKGKLYMLQTRTGKRTAAAAVRIAVEMVEEALISKETAVLRVEPDQLDQLLHPMFDPIAEKVTLAKGLPASPGAASGQVVFNADDAVEWTGNGKKVILVRLETSPDDIEGMHVAEGILTARGGMTSHAAVVARGMGKCCVAGVGAISVDYKNKLFKVNGKTISEGDWISLDGSEGLVYEGEIPTIEPELSGYFEILMGWADEFRRLKVRTNTDTPKDSRIARAFGAQGIGLTRTEHMFFGPEPERLPAMQEMILAPTEELRRNALDKLLPYQRADFYGIFKAMHGLPVTIRLLDPPLHEFLPREDDKDFDKDVIALADALGLDIGPEDVKTKIKQLHEFNPMLGHRGCRLSISFPEIAEMQARAIFEAACDLKEEGMDNQPEVMIPLIGTVQEFDYLDKIIRRVAEEVFADKGFEVEYLVGTMIEIPRAALVADEIAKGAEFFSFGTNDLTQMAFGYSRDDAGVFLPEYVDKGILPDDPFQTIDQAGVGKLMEMGIELGRRTNPNLKIGICGEHGGDPRSVEFCHKINIDYVSCSPYRVPIARLAAAHAVLKEKGFDG
ncbi:MAG: pyruvate, phosphate dikinase [bacterium]|nr:pyruvate, phosphate dikinase [bacterium]